MQSSRLAILSSRCQRLGNEVFTAEIPRVAVWFGKGGISWHISVVYRRSEDQLQWQDSFTSSSLVVKTACLEAIMKDVLRSIKAEYLGVRRAYFRQDHAGCYHSSATFLACPVISVLLEAKSCALTSVTHRVVKGLQIALQPRAKLTCTVL